VEGVKIAGIDHVVLRTAQLETILTFYSGLLGLPIERSIVEIGLYQLRAGAALVDVVDANIWKTQAGPGETLYDHFCLGVAGNDVDGLLAALDAAGIEHSAAEERYGASGYGKSVYAKDPDGRTVELKLVG
jgi:catechol 2,3-dioxygenase-like lactoylglutathione lyase family enzyme